jgi:hypothetical protein
LRRRLDARVGGHVVMAAQERAVRPIRSGGHEVSSSVGTRFSRTGMG